MRYSFLAGLTLGLLSLDEMSLEVLRRSGTEREQKYAAKIIPVIARPHHLLVTLVRDISTTVCFHQHALCPAALRMTVTLTFSHSCCRC